MGDVIQFPGKTEVEQVVADAKKELAALGIDASKAFQGAVKEVGKVAEEIKTEVKAAGSTIEKTVDEKTAQSQQFIMGLIDKNRRDGLVQFAQKVEALGARTETFVEAGLENTMRDIRAGLTGALTHIQASASLTEYIKHDLVACIENIESHTATLMQISGYIQSLIVLLVKKGIVSHEEMEATWNETVKPNLEALQKQSQTAPPT